MDCKKTLLRNISCLGPFKAEYILRFVFVPMLSLSPHLIQYLLSILERDMMQTGGRIVQIMVAKFKDVLPGHLTI
jgi:hypothetical protein